MSAGPIQHAREAYKPARVSTTAKDRICSPDLGTGRTRCGRRTQRTATWDKVTCADCHAAARADG